MRGGPSSNLLLEYKLKEHITQVHLLYKYYSKIIFRFVFFITQYNM